MLKEHFVNFVAIESFCWMVCSVLFDNDNNLNAFADIE